MKTEVEENDLGFESKQIQKEEVDLKQDQKKSKRKRKTILILTLIFLIITSIILVVLSRLLRFGIWQIASSSSGSSSSSTTTSSNNNCHDIYCSSQYSVCFQSNCPISCNFRLHKTGDGYSYNVTNIGWSLQKLSTPYYDGGVSITIRDPTQEACKLDTSKYTCLSSNEVPNATFVQWSAKMGIQLYCY